MRMDFEAAGHQLPVEGYSGEAFLLRCRFCGILWLSSAVLYPQCTFQAERFLAQYGIPLLSPAAGDYAPLIKCEADPDRISFRGYR